MWFIRLKFFVKRKDIPNITEEEKLFEHQIMFVESTSESLLQFCLSCVIIRQFGIIKADTFGHSLWRWVQILSVFTSGLSLYMNFVKVNSLISYNIRIQIFDIHN